MKRLADYLELMKEAREKGQWLEVKRLGEAALKKLSRLPATSRLGRDSSDVALGHGTVVSPMEKYTLYHRLGIAYTKIYHYSAALDIFHKAYLIALKHHLGPEYLASVSYNLGNNFLNLNNFNLAMRQYQKVEQYYQRYKFKKMPMDLNGYINVLKGIGYCYLDQSNYQKAREIIEEKLPSYQSRFDKYNSIGYYELKGYYLATIKDYAGARTVFQELLKLCAGEVDLLPVVIQTQIGLAILDVLENKIGSALVLLKTILREARRLVNKAEVDGVTCQVLLLLSKSYALIGSNDKAALMEKRFESRLKTVDRAWFYEFNKEIERIYRQVELAGEGDKTGGAVTRARDYINGQLATYHPAGTEDPYVIIGKSPVLQEVFQLIERTAPTNLPVLIYGQTGTGKELVARAVHQKSLRSRNTWLACNTGAIPETLLESELFGYVKGAFTGAQTDKKGYIELASGGTLFLDEVGSMSLGMQQKLLRVMEDNELWRVGAEKPISVNTRFVLASNEDLEELVKIKRFREDLYYRINTIIINLPPLRDRKEDIPLLIQHFLRKCLLPSQVLPDLSSSALAILTAYPWPGNVRELENEIKRISTLYPGEKIITEAMISESIREHAPMTSGHVRLSGQNIQVDSAGSDTIAANSPKEATLKEMTEQFQKNVIIKTLKEYKGNISRVARRLGYNRTGFYKKLQDLGIDLANVD